MNLLYKKKNPQSFDYDSMDRPIIELVKLEANAKGFITVCDNEIVFFLDGKLHLNFNTFPEYIAGKGEVILLPSEENFFYTALSDCSIVIFRINQPGRYLDIFQSESLSGIFESYSEEIVKHQKIHSLKISSFTHLFLENLRVYLNEGLKCIHFFELKTKELFLILKANYTKDEIRYLLPFIINKDIKLSGQSQSDKYLSC